MKRDVFFISDGTGITAENLGNSLLSQFEELQFTKHSLPYVQNIDEAYKAVAVINQAYIDSNIPPLIFTTLVNAEIRDIIETSHGVTMDLFKAFIAPLEIFLGVKSSYSIGKYHSIKNEESYTARIEAVNFALAHDDGVGFKGYEEADVILFGVSRSGKTPTCLYLAMQFGIKAANYPYTHEDMQTQAIPPVLKEYKKKLFGLLIDAERLHSIRSERRRGSPYATLANCRRELQDLKQLLDRDNIPYLDATHHSIEELATKIITSMQLTKQI